MQRIGEGIVTPLNTLIDLHAKSPRDRALPRERQSQKRRSSSKSSAFTLIELMIVIVIIGVLLNISMPSFIRARESARSKACIDNLKQIDGAKEQLAMDQKLATGAADPGMAALAGAGNYIKSTPICSSGGTYTVAAIGTTPTCIIGANSVSPFAPHQLPY